MRRNELDLPSQVAKNLITNPAMVTKTSGTDTVLTNHAPNPDFTGTTVTMGGIGGNPASWTSTTFATDKARSGTRSWKLANCTVAGQAGRKQMLNSGGLKMVKGQKISWSFWIYSTVAGSMIPYWEGRKVSDNSYTGGGAAAVNIPANQWTYVSGTATLSIDSYVEGAGGYNLSVNVGDSVWWDDFCITQTDTPVPYFDGNTAAAGGYTYAWTGTANNSPSVRKAAAAVVRTNLVANPTFKGGTLSNVRTNLLTNPSFETGNTTTDVWTNNVMNPAFRATSGTVETRRNLVNNPSFEVGSGTLDVRTNLAPNPAMEAAGGTTNLRSNLAVNPSFETASTAVTVRTNLLTNPSFEVDISGWTTNNENYVVARDNTTAYRGAASGKVTINTDGVLAGVNNVNAPATVTAGMTVTASAWVKASKDMSLAMMLRFRSADMSVNTGDFTGAYITATSGGWQRVSYTYTAPAASERVFIQVQVGSAVVAGDAYWIDNVLLEVGSKVLPYFDGANPITNVVTNPSFATNLTDWISMGSATRVTTKGDGHMAEVSQTVENGIRQGMIWISPTALPAGDYTVSFDMEATDASFTEARVLLYDAPTGLTRAIQSKTVVKSNIVRYTFNVTATGEFTRVYFEATGANIPLGTKTWIDRAVVEPGTTAGDYYEGTGDFTFAWSGTANASTSTQTALRVASLTNIYNCAPVQSSLWAGNGTKSLRIIPTSSTTNESFVSIDGTWGSFGTLVRGRTYTVAATLRLTAPLTSTLFSRALSISFRDDNGRTQYVAGTNTAGEQRLVLTFTVPASGTTYGFIEFHNGASVGNGEVYWDDVVLEEGTLAGAYFDGSTPLTNLATNPSFAADTSGWSVSGTATLARDTAFGYVGSTSMKATTSTAPAYSGAVQSVNTVPDKFYTVSAYAYVPTGSTLNFACDNLDSPAQNIVGNNTWQRIRMTGRAKGTSTPVYFRSIAANQTPFWIDGVLVERSMTLNPFFEGTAEVTYAWAGPSQGSVSYQQGTVVTGYGIYNAAGISSTAWKGAYGTKSMKVVPVTTSFDSFVDVGGDTGGLRLGMTVGKTYTVSATCRLAAPYSSTPSSRARKIVVFTRNGTDSYVEHHSNQAANAAGETRLSVTFTVPTGGTEAFVRLYHGGNKENGDIWYDNLLIEETSVVRPYFDGTIPAQENLVKTTATALNPEISHTTNVSFAGSTWTRATVTAGTGYPINRQYVNLVELDNGETYTASVTVANDQSVSQTISLDWCDTATVTVTLAPGEIRRIKTTSSRTVYDSTFRFSDLHVNQDSGGTRSVLFKDWMVEKGTTAGDYYYTGTGDFTYAWTGTANASTSVQRAVQVTGVSSVPSLCRAYQSSYGATAGSKTVRVTASGSSNDVFAELVGMFSAGSFKANTTYTISADRILPAPLVGLSGTNVRVNIGTELPLSTITAPTNVAGRSRLVVRFTTGSDTALNFIRLYSGTPAGGGDAWFDRLIVEEGFTDGSYFDGTTPAYQNIFTNPSAETAGLGVVTNTNYLLNPLGKLTTNVDVGPNVTVVHNGTTGVTVTHKNGVASGDAFYAAHCNIVSGVTYYARAVLEDVTGTPAAVAGIHSSVGTYVGSQTAMTRSGNTLVRDWSIVSNYTGLARLIIDYSGAGTGESFRVKEMIVSDRPLDGMYFDGSTAPTSNGYSHLWEGVANASISRQTAPTATGWNYWSGGTGGAVGYRWSSADAYVGSALYRVKWHTSQTGSNLGGAYVDGTVVGGITYSGRVKARTNKNQTLRLSVEWYAPSGAFISSSAGTDTAVTANQWADLKIENITAPSYATLGRLTVYSAALGTPWLSGDTLDTDAALFEVGTTARPYYEGTGDFTYAWVGTVNASASIQRAPSVVASLASKSSGVGYVDARFTVYQGIDETGKKYSRWFSQAGSPNSAWRVVNVNTQSLNWSAITAGSTYTLIMKYRSSGWGSTQNFTVSLKDGTALNPIMSDETRSLTAPTWTEYRRTFTALINGLNTTNLYITLPVTPQATTDGIFDIAEWALVPGNYTGPFFDGTSVSTSADYSYMWTGTADASTSVLRGNHVNDVVTANFGDNLVKPITSTEWSASTGKSMRIVPVGASTGVDTSITLHGSSSSGTGSLVPGKTYTVKATFRQAAPQIGTLHTRARGIMFADSVTGWAAAPVVAATNTAGSQTLTHTFTVPSAATWATVRLYNGASAGNGDVWWDDVVMVEGPYTGNYFDGATAASGDFSYAWAGTANSSVSYQKAPSLAGWATESKLTAWITETGTLRLEVKDHTGGGGRSTVPWQAQDQTMTLTTGNKYTIRARGRKLDSGVSYRIAGNLVGELPLTTSMSDITVTLTATSGPTYLEHPGRIGAGTEWEYFGIFNEGDPVTYFDGDTSGHDGLTYRWKGTPNVSQSEQIAPQVSGYSLEPNIRQWPVSDGAMRTINISGTTHSLQSPNAMTVGRVYTVLFRAKTYRSANINIFGMGASKAVTLTSSYDWYRVTGAATDTRLYFSTTGGIAGAGWDISHMMITEGTYTGGYIDGNSYGARWDGSAHVSTSLGFPVSLESMAGKPLFTGTTPNSITVLDPSVISDTSARTVYSVVDNILDIPTAGMSVVVAYGVSTLDDTVPNTYLTMRMQSTDGPTNTNLVRRTLGGGPQSIGVPSSGRQILVGGIDENAFLFSGFNYSSLVRDTVVMSIPHQKIHIQPNTAYHQHIITYIYAGFHNDTMRAEIVKLLAQKHSVSL